MAHPLDAHALPGVGTLRRARLAEAGITTLEALIAADPQHLAALPGLTSPVVDRARDAARQILEAPPPAPLPDVPDLPGSADVAPPQAETSDSPRVDWMAASHRRGMVAARRLEMTLDAVRRCRAHAKASEEDLPPVRPALKRLRKVLGRLQREAITHGLSERALADIEALLDKLDVRLDRFVAKPPSFKRAYKLLERVQTAERRLVARIG
jgi:hypothetical protein